MLVFLAILNEGLKFFILIKNSPRSLSSFCIKFRSFVKFISFVLTPELLPDKKKKSSYVFHARCSDSNGYGGALIYLYLLTVL